MGDVNEIMVLGALAGAISWQVVTGYFGIPSSSSHALIGGLVGAGDPLTLVMAGLGLAVEQVDASATTVTMHVRAFENQAADLSGGILVQCEVTAYIER